MAGGSVEATLELWASSLRDIKGRIRPLFQRARMADSAALFLDALLGPERRKTGWMRAEAAGDPGPWRQQAVLGRSRWEADALRDLVRDYALETLAEPEAVLVIDETGFLKQGQASCGVGRQYTGSAGKITNCQIGGFAAYVSDKGLAFFSTWCPAGTLIETLVRVEGRRWAIEDAFETAKTELGLAHNETRSWHGWHRHVSLVMLAFALLAVSRHRAATVTSPQKSAADERRRQWCDGLSRKSGGWL